MIEISWRGWIDYRNANFCSTFDQVKGFCSKIERNGSPLTPGARIKEARAMLKLTTRAMGGALGISGSMVSEWESGKLLLRQPYAVALEYLYGISWKWLMTGEGEMWATEIPLWIGQKLGVGEALTPAPAPNTDALSQTAMGLAIAQCQAAGTAGNPADLVRAFKDILARLQA